MRENVKSVETEEIAYIIFFLKLDISSKRTAGKPDQGKEPVFPVQNSNANTYVNCYITDLLINIHSSYHSAAFVLVIRVKLRAKAACYTQSVKLDV